MPNKLSFYVNNLVDFYRANLAKDEYIRRSYWGNRYTMLWVFPKDRRGRYPLPLYHHYMRGVYGDGFSQFRTEHFAEAEGKIGADTGQTFKDFIAAIGGRGSQSIDARTPRVLRIMGILERRLRLCNTMTASIT